MALETVAVSATRSGRLDVLSQSVTLGDRRFEILDLAATAVIGLGGGIQGWALHATGLGFDDVRLQASTAHRGLAAVGGPVTRGAVRLLAGTAPLQSLPVLASGLLLRALLALAVWLLLRRLLRPSAALLVPLAVVAASPALLLADTGMLRVFGPLTAVTATGWAAVALVRASGAWQVGGVVLATAVAAGADRVGAITPVVLLALALTFPGPLEAGPGKAGPGKIGPGKASADRRRPAPPQVPALSASAVVVLVVLGVPALRPVGLTDPDHLPGGADVLTALTTVLGGVGGLPWHESTRVLDVLLRSTAATVLGSLVCGVLAVAVRRAPRQAARAVGFGATWALGSAVLGLPRPTEATGALLGLTVAVATTVVLAILPEAAPPGAAPPGAAPPGPVGLDRSWSGLAVPPLAVPPLVVVPLVVVLLAVPSAVSHARDTRADPLAAWLGQVRTTLDGLRPFPRIAARAVPSTVTGGPGAEPGTPGVVTFDSDVVTLLRPDALVHDADGPQQTLDDSGRLRPVRVRRLGGSRRAALCVASVQPGQAADALVPLVKPVPLPTDAQIRLEVLITGTTRLNAVVERSDGRADPVLRWSDDLLYEGPHTVVLPVSAATTATAVRVRPSAPQAGMCVVAVDVVRML